MVAVLFHSGNFVDTYMGFRKEAVAHPSGIQHHLDLDFVYGAGTAFDINTLMYNFLSVMAVNAETGQVREDVTDGKRFLLSQRAEAQAACLEFGASVSKETGQTWHGIVRVYHPDNPTPT